MDPKQISWQVIAKEFTDRSAKQCHQHWSQQMAPRSQEPWNDAEDKRLFLLVQEHGKSWATIAKLMTSRTRN